jgi:hypothetical protein
MPYVQGI